MLTCIGVWGALGTHCADAMAWGHPFGWQGYTLEKFTRMCMNIDCSLVCSSREKSKGIGKPSKLERDELTVIPPHMDY